jgi:L,D-transpeptidase ErfK/SrfK
MPRPHRTPHRTSPRSADHVVTAPAPPGRLSRRAALGLFAATAAGLIARPSAATPPAAMSAITSWPPPDTTGPGGSDDFVGPEPVDPPLVTLNGDIFGAMSTYVTWDDTNLLDLARSEELGLIELMAANPGVDPWYPGKGVSLVLPTAHILPKAPREGIVINVAELRLYYFHRDKGVFSFPLGVGRDGFSTPAGQTKIVRKKAGPAWYPTAAKRAEDPTVPAVVPAGPDNPLGDYALYLGWPTYLIHGTSKPWGVGRRVSRGCIRLYPEDIEWLFANVPVGTKVTVVNQSIKLGKRDGELYIEVHPSLAQIDQIEETKQMQPEPIPDQTDAILMAAGDAIERIDWPTVERALSERRGYPVQITF